MLVLLNWPWQVLLLLVLDRPVPNRALRIAKLGTKRPSVMDNPTITMLNMKPISETMMQ
jgi:hypothetical protein